MKELLISDSCMYDALIGNERYVRACVMMPFWNVGDDRMILFERRAATIRQGGEICLPGGKVSPDPMHGEKGATALPIDHSLREALRECREETGIPSETFLWTGYAGSLISQTGYFIDTFIGEVPPETADILQPNPGEVAELFTVPFSHFLDNEPETLRIEVTIRPEKDEDMERDFLATYVGGYQNSETGVWRARKDRIRFYPAVGKLPHVIWGITAEIASGLAVRFKRLSSADRTPRG